VEYGPHRAVIGEPVATAALVPDLLHPLPAPQDPVTPANNYSSNEQRENKTISVACMDINLCVLGWASDQ